ncbi:MAG: hypothetical protein FWG40_12555 [Peptococcaceae bacterium]|nr:hypothetical protein [Peptococcaceae bacterium]
MGQNGVAVTSGGCVAGGFFGGIARAFGADEVTPVVIDVDSVVSEFVGDFVFAADESVDILFGDLLVEVVVCVFGDEFVVFGYVFGFLDEVSEGVGIRRRANLLC